MLIRLICKALIAKVAMLYIYINTNTQIHKYTKFILRKEKQLMFEKIKDRYANKEEKEMSLQEYLDLCKKDPMAYADTATRMLKAIGEPEKVDTSKDARLRRIFSNQIINIYKPFKDFYGMEKAIDDVVSYFKHAAQGLEESKQILYLLGPVGGGKTSLAEKIKQLAEQEPVYMLKGSPVFESPLGLFDEAEDGDILQDQYGIDKRHTKITMSPWTVKRLHEYGGDISKFRVVKTYPSILDQRCISKTEPGDENNQDISTLVGKVNIRELESYAQNDTDAYSYSGGLCLANRGIMEFVEMFKAPIKMLHPLLTATQESNYNGTESIGGIPFDGIVVAHSNESEWETFKANQNNEAFIDRVFLVKVPYCLRVQEETEIYKKLLDNSELKNAPCAPDTLEMLAKFIAMTRLKDPQNSNIFTKLHVYNGEDLKEKDPEARSVQDYKDDAGVDEGMNGLSTRFAFKLLSKTFNFPQDEIAANPVHLMFVIENQIMQEQFSQEMQSEYLSYLKNYLRPKYIEYIKKEIQTAFFESYSEYGQNVFDNYINYADHYVQREDYRDPETGEKLDYDMLNEELYKIEMGADIYNAEEFRRDVVGHVLRVRATNGGKNPKWTSYEKLKTVIEHKMFSNTEDLLPVISFNAKGSDDEKKKHQEFVKRMMASGYTEKQVRLLVDWWIKARKSH